MKKGLILVFLLMLQEVYAQTAVQLKDSNQERTSFISLKPGKLIFKDDFDKSLDNWIAEIPKSPASRVVVKGGKMVIDVNGGATVWLNKKLLGNIMITYNRRVIVDTGKNDRLSDFNQFWMAKDPKNKNLFTRSGVFKEYDSLLLYYVGLGGNTNSTTRFRKYTGNGDRVLYKDYTDKAHLLEANRTYSVKTIVYNGVTKFYIDDHEFFSYQDPKPLTEGFFGFRTTESRQEISDFKVYQLK